LRFFAGLTVDEAGKDLGMSTATAYRYWKYARAWLHRELLGTQPIEQRTLSAKVVTHPVERLSALGDSFAERETDRPARQHG
jgi:hypothetical protein